MRRSGSHLSTSVRPLAHEPPSRGAVSTPAALADWVAAHLLEAAGAAVGTVVDPACGEGALLTAVERRAPGRYRLVGYDLDAGSVALASSRLPGMHGFVLDALVDGWPGLPPSAPVGAIVNPPWGAALPHSARALQARGYRLATGQFDSYELFVERLVRDLPRGSTVAAIVPDSILLPQHARLRGLLVSGTTLLTLARLGEGLFPSVYRGAVVALLRTARPAPAHRVRCIRLRKADRRAVTGGAPGPGRALAGRAHEVEQASLARGSEVRLDIHAREHDRRVLARFEAGRLAWGAWYALSRGVEIGKRGRVVACPACGRYRPEPRTGSYRCRGCGQVRSTAGSVRTTIVRQAGGGSGPGSWAPVVAGEDVDRHRLRVRRAIRLGLPGIDYKDLSLYAGPRVLVRKTGIGIKAALDETGLVTTQVVYQVARTPGSPDLALGYLAGVLASRCLLAYHLCTSGELEWRSHPYVTPKVLRTLPLPDPGRPGSAGWEAAAEIARRVRGMARGGYDARTDLRVESLVARLFGLARGDLEWVAGVLDAADDLEPIRTLRFDPARLVSGP